MSTINSRGNAVINSSVELKISFKLNESYYDPYQISDVSVYLSDPDDGLLIDTYTPVREELGRYKITVPVNTLEVVGVYSDFWTWIWKEGETAVTKTQDFYVSSATVVDMITRVRRRLKDTHPSSEKRRWNDSELSEFLEQAVWDINATPPGDTTFTLDTFEDNVPNWRKLLIDGAIIMAMEAQMSHEIAKTFSYSDNGISINIDRSGKYQALMTAMRQSYEKQISLIKKQYWMSNIKPHIVLGPQLEFKIRTYAPSQTRVR
jgi:hypothetical protein